MYFPTLAFLALTMLTGLAASTPPTLSDFFANVIVREFGGSDGVLNASQLEAFIEAVTNPKSRSQSLNFDDNDVNATLHSLDAEAQTLTECLSAQTEFQRRNCSAPRGCLSADDLLVLSLQQTNNVHSVDASALATLAPTILYQAATGVCFRPPVPSHDPNHKRRVPIYVSIGYGVLFVTIISLCSLGGAVVLPFVNKVFYKRLLTWMVGLAVGTLAGSGLLHLMPHTYGMSYEETGSLDYLYKASAIFAGSYLFFVTERLLKTISEKRREKRNRRDKAAEALGGGSSQTTLETMSNDRSSVSTISNVNNNGHVGQGHAREVTEQEEEQKIAPVAWMIIFGDGLHNFIDGLSIGAAFTESILAGISISVAVFCEEFPHELGDLAILLNSGMRFKQALLYNFLSACMCFLGLCLGIFLGDVTQSGAKWIFALAAGMFLYLALTDMIPELNKQAEELLNEGTPLWKIMIIQHSGVLTGFFIMLLMAIYGGNIDFT